MAVTEFPFDWPYPSWTPDADPSGQLENILSGVIGFLTSAAVIYFVIQTILAGYAWISAGGDSQKLEEARKKLTQSVLGITIVFFAVALVGLLGFLLGGVNLLHIPRNLF